MSETIPPSPPPTPGTTPLLRREEFPTLRPYREELKILTADRAAGRRTYPDQAREARVEAVARDLAAKGDKEGPLRPALGAELIADMEVMLTQQVHHLAAERTRADAAARRTAAELAVLRERGEQSELALRRARTDVPHPPMGGAHFTSWWVAFVIAPVLAYLEIRLGAPAIGPALSISETEAALVAVGAAVVLTVAADVLGLVLGSVVRDHRRAARAMLVGLALALTCSGGWTVAALATGRSHNLFYRDCKKARAEATQRALETEAAGEEEALKNLTRKGREEGSSTPRASLPAVSVNPGCDNVKPDLGFTIPLTLMAMLAAAVLATRVALAADWNSARDTLRSAETDASSLRKHLDAARIGEPAIEQPATQSDIELAMEIERETTFTERLFALLSTEYERWCAHFRTPVQLLVLPEVPEPAELMARMLGGVREEPAGNPQSDHDHAHSRHEPEQEPPGPEPSSPPTGAPEDDRPSPQADPHDGTYEPFRSNVGANNGESPSEPTWAPVEDEPATEFTPPGSTTADEEPEFNGEPAGYVYDEPSM